MRLESPRGGGKSSRAKEKNERANRHGWSFFLPGESWVRRRFLRKLRVLSTAGNGVAQTQSQIAAAASRGIMQANRRNI